LFLPRAHPGRVVSLCGSHAFMSKQDGDPLNWNTCQQEFYGESIAEALWVAATDPREFKAGLELFRENQVSVQLRWSMSRIVCVPMSIQGCPQSWTCDKSRKEFPISAASCHVLSTRPPMVTGIRTLQRLYSLAPDWHGNCSSILKCFVIGVWLFLSIRLIGEGKSVPSSFLSLL
jgi:hypothetical protein